MNTKPEGQRPPTLMELIDAFAEAHSATSVASAHGATAAAVASRREALKLRTEIDRRLNELASTLVTAINSLADTKHFPKEGS